jgi:hypothetical protein
MDEAQVEGRLRQSRNGRGFDKEQTVSDKSNRERIQRRKTFATKFHPGTTPGIRIRDIPAQKVRRPGTSVFPFLKMLWSTPPKKSIAEQVEWKVDSEPYPETWKDQIETLLRSEAVKDTLWHNSSSLRWANNLRQCRYYESSGVSTQSHLVLITRSSQSVHSRYTPPSSSDKTPPKIWSILWERSPGVL